MRTYHPTGRPLRPLAASARRTPRPPRASAAAPPPLTPLLTASRVPTPITDTVTAFAPATVANLGPGFDWLGCAVAVAGDTVTARALPGQRGVVVVASIEGDGGRLSLDPSKNCAGIAAAAMLTLMGTPDAGVELTVHKGLPLGSGLGSSAASAAAAAAAVSSLFGDPLPRTAQMLAGLASEAAVSGYHADNIAPAVLGGFVLVRSASPLDVHALAWGAAASTPPPPLFFALVNPVFEAPTAEMRAVLPPLVPFSAAVSNAAAGGALVAAIVSGDPAALGEALDADALVEPVRGPLIPGFGAVKAAAAAAGALGCTISGAGPTCVAIVESAEVGEKVAAAMGAAFEKEGGLAVASARVAALDTKGARVV